MMDSDKQLQMAIFKFIADNLTIDISIDEYEVISTLYLYNPITQKAEIISSTSDSIPYKFRKDLKD